MRFGMIGNPLRLRLYGPYDSNVKGIGAYCGQIERIFTHYLGAQPTTWPDLRRPTKLAAESRRRLELSTGSVCTENAEVKTISPAFLYRLGDFCVLSYGFLDPFRLASISQRGNLYSKLNDPKSMDTG